ncbi:n-acetylglucosamine-6-phosphate deacetylase [Absidia repens]|uniref:N-acetylglucosamine-6-phosphate deacetylase n=1 Tax=Absidia repens TaxID=90262 RepID=A0A1X2IJV9_9FUNG|nr:n-acetylglucosamine-6-phosphate deacetylase [Absidia repens]
MAQDEKLYKIINAKILHNHELLENDYLWFQNGKIVDAKRTFFEQRREPDQVIDAQGCIVAPGFLDIQINGSYGIDFADHDGSEEKLKQDIATVAKGLLQDGCTSFCPTVVTSKPEVYSKVLPFLRRRPGNAKTNSEILGAHVEGPFISQEKKGAHDVDVIRSAPNGIADFDDAYGPELKRGSDAVCIMTVAPEIDGVLDAMPELIKRGITVSLGHSAAQIQAAEAGVAKGACLMTHLFNAMLPFHQRDPGMVGILGATDLPPPEQPDRHPLPSTTSPDRHQPDPRPFYGVICDGIHVHPNSVRIAYYSHPRGCVLVTDALSAAGLPHGTYQLGGRDVEVRHGGAYIKGTNTLAGSTVTIDQAVRNFWKFTRCTKVEALEAATLHPAQSLGIQDRKGTFTPGADADLVFLDDDLNLKRVFVRGDEVVLTKKR